MHKKKLDSDYVVELNGDKIPSKSMNCSRSLMEAQYVVPYSNLPSLSWLHLKCKQAKQRPVVRLWTIQPCA